QFNQYLKVVFSRSWRGSHRLVTMVATLVATRSQGNELKGRIMSKSYKNPEFMTGDEARPLRLLAEYIEPRSRLAAYGVQRALIFWGSARLRPMSASPVHVSVDYCEQARELAARMAQWTMDSHADDEHYYICTGGGPGIMEAANRG